MSWKCPKCQKELDYLHYSVPIRATESGRSYLTKENVNKNDRDDESEMITEDDYSDTDNTEWDGDKEYSCPECYADIYVQDLVWNTEDREANEEVQDIETPNAEVKTIENRAVFCGYDKQRSFINNTDICPKCRNLFLAEDGGSNWEGERCTNKQDEITCPYCQHQFTYEEELKALKNKLKVIKTRKYVKRI